MPTLKEEWIERLKIKQQRNVFPEGGGRFTVMTDFYLAPDEIRYDKEMCFKVLLESDECMWNIPKEIKTTEFLNELLEKGYKGNILLAKKVWEEEHFPFIKNYLAKFNKDNKPEFDSWITFSPAGIFKNRDMILSLVADNEFKETRFLLNNYKKDKDMMFALLDNNPNEIRDMLKSIKNAYFKNEANIFKVLTKFIGNYCHLPEKIQMLDSVIDFALSKDGKLFQYIPKQITENRDKAFALIKKHNNLKAENLWSMYTDDFEIAKYMVERKGSNLTYFNFIKNDELLKLAAKTFDDISYMPATKEYEELIRSVVLRAGPEDNNKNLSHSRGNGPKTQMVKDLFPQLLKEGKVYHKTVADFFSHHVVVNEKTEVNFKLDRQLWLECIQVSPYVYEKTDSWYKKEIDIEVLHYYVGACNAKGCDYKMYVPEEIKDQARTAKVDLDKYILNEYLSNKLKPLAKVKQHKI